MRRKKNQRKEQRGEEKQGEGKAARVVTEEEK